MSASNRTRLALVLIWGLIASVPAEAAAKLDLVIFGDSLSDTGNRYVVKGIKSTPPHDLLPAENYIPSFPYAIGGATFTNGAVWVEYFAKAVGRAGASQPTLASNGIASNYAYAGARASNAPPVPPNDNLNLVDQVNQYLADVNGEAPSDALYVIFIGGADIGEAIRAYIGVGPSVAAHIIENAVTSVAHNVNQLYGAGARRFFFITAPNTGAIPAFAPFRPEVVFLGAELTTAYNAGVQSAVMGPLLAQGAEVTVLDGQALFDDLRQDPASYGFTNVSDRCVMAFVPPYRCRRPDEYLYWDNIHPTASVHEIIADAAIDLLERDRAEGY